MGQKSHPVGGFHGPSLDSPNSETPSLQEPSVSERQSPPAIDKVLIFPPVLGCSPHLYPHTLGIFTAFIHCGALTETAESKKRQAPAVRVVGTGAVAALGSFLPVWN